MRIAQVSTVSAPVRQDAGGSVEALIWLLTRELARVGHEVTVFGIAGSEPAGELVATLPGPYGSHGTPDDWQLCEWINLCEAVRQSGRFDVVHSHAYLWGMPLEPFSQSPMVHTIHIVPDDNAACLWQRKPEACVTAISKHQWSEYPKLHPAAIIPHGVDLSQFSYREKPDDYVCYLGRFISGKGPCQAIAAARALGVRLLLAGPRNGYFKERVEPLVDGKSVEYIGPVNSSERSKLLGGARALLYPIQYPEPFGLVMVEAMLSGTPVAAMRLGAVTEIIAEGVTGYSAVEPGNFQQAVTKCFELERPAIRRFAEERFSAERMARDYLRLYEQIGASKLTR